MSVKLKIKYGLEVYVLSINGLERSFMSKQGLINAINQLRSLK